MAAEKLRSNLPKDEEVTFRKKDDTNSEKFRSKSQDFEKWEWKQTPLQKIAQKVQNRFSWSGEELDFLVNSQIIRKKSTSSNSDSKMKRRSWLDQLRGKEELKKELENDGEIDDIDQKEKEREKMLAKLIAEKLHDESDSETTKSDTTKSEKKDEDDETSTSVVDSEENKSPRKMDLKKKKKESSRNILIDTSDETKKRKKEKDNSIESPRKEKSKEKPKKDKESEKDRSKEKEKKDKDHDKEKEKEIDKEKDKDRDKEKKKEKKEKSASQEEEKKKSKKKETEGDDSVRSKHRSKKKEELHIDTDISTSPDEKKKRRTKNTPLENSESFIEQRTQEKTQEPDDVEQRHSLVIKIKKYLEEPPSPSSPERRKSTKGIKKVTIDQESLKNSSLENTSEGKQLTSEEKIALKKETFRMRSLSSGSGLSRSKIVDDGNSHATVSLPEKKNPIVRSQTLTNDIIREESQSEENQIDQDESGEVPVVQMRNKKRAPPKSVIVEYAPISEDFFKDTKRTGFCIPHRFNQISAISTRIFKLRHCQHCQQAIWGLRTNATKCQDCSIIVHVNCAPMVPPTCGISPELIQMKQQLESMGKAPKTVDDYFGQDIEMQAKEEGRLVPRLVSMCVTAIEQRGLEIEGIYRISGSSAQIEKLKLMFRYGRPKLEESEWPDINVITGVLKHYFRELPIPLCTYSLYDSFVSCVQSDGDEVTKLVNLQTVLQSLPAVNYATMRFMIRHLRRVVDKSVVNKMSSENLALLFGPALFRSPRTSRFHLDMQSQNKLVDLMIKNSFVLFPNMNGYNSFANTLYRRSNLL